jgi:hypothetical protein
VKRRTNPTWWDDESPTLQDLPAPLTVADVAVLDDRGVPVYEHYGAHGGYVVSPHAPFVRQRLGQLVEQMTVDVPGDVLFEDQIGARPWPFDHNPSSPHPMAYIEGWLEHTRTYSRSLGAACPTRLRKSGERHSEAEWARSRPTPRQFRALLRLPKSGGCLPDETSEVWRSAF